MSKTMLPRVLLVGLALLLPLTAAHAEDPPLVRATNAVTVLNEIMQAPDKAIPHDLLRDAKAIAVIPGMLKVGFVFGGRRGEGLISVKSPDGTWSNPSFITMTGGSVGFQAGVTSTDVVLVFRTQKGVDSIVGGKFTLGADAAAAAVPAFAGMTAGDGYPGIPMVVGGRCSCVSRIPNPDLSTDPPDRHPATSAPCVRPAARTVLVATAAAGCAVRRG
ncbi:lipid-binding SYLF domain-containing protein [Rhodanobacter lindaniclasticus]